jgi:hypothetical protein
MNLRGKRVLARCAADGSFVDEGGRVEIRYSPRDGKAYHASLRNLEAIPGDTALLPDDHCAALAPSAPSAPAGAAKKPAAATRSPAKRAPRRAARPPRGPNPARCWRTAMVRAAATPGPPGSGSSSCTTTCAGSSASTSGRAPTTSASSRASCARASRRPTSRARCASTRTPPTPSGCCSRAGRPRPTKSWWPRARPHGAHPATVSLHYVKGHAGVPLNEAADVLAVTAVERRRSTPWVKVSG